MEIYVLPDGLSVASDKLADLSNDMANIEMRFKNICNSLDWQVKSKATISNYMNKLSREIDKTESALKKHSAFMKNARAKYLEVDNSRRADELKFETIGQSSYKEASSKAKDGAYSNSKSKDESEKSWFHKFFFGDINKQVSKHHGAVEGGGKILGIGTGGKLSGDLFYGEASIKNNSSFEFKDEKGNLNFDTFGISSEASITGGVAKGEAKGNIGLLNGEAAASLITGAASGSVKATLFNDGKFDPSLAAEGKISGSVASGSVSVGAGDENFGTHIGAEGDFLYGEVTGKVGVGYFTDSDGKTRHGVMAEAGAMASVAQGKVKSDITIMGVKIEASVKGYFGVAGGKIGGGVTTDGAKCSLDLGLGLGGGLDVDIDWSGFNEWVEKTFDLSGFPNNLNIFSRR